MTADHQRRASRIATISALMVIAAFVCAKAARDAILLTHFSIHSLPLFTGIAAVVSFPVILLAGRCMARFGPAWLVPVTNLVSAAAAIGEWLLLPSYPRVIAVVVFFHLTCASGVLVSGFWSIVNERFDVQSAKRHIGRIGMGATLGGIFGGVVAERTAVYMTPDKVLLVLASMQIICAVMLAVFGRGSHGPKSDIKSESTITALKEAAKEPLLRNVAAIVVLGAVAAGVLDYVFKADIVGGAGDPSLLRSLAMFYTATNVITAVVQLALCGPLVTKLGVPKSVASLPITLSAFGLAALVVPIPITATIARASELVTRNSLYRSSYELLYAPLPEDRKRPTKVLLDVGADKVGDILGAQLVSAIVFLAIDTRAMLLLAVVITSVLAVVVAMRLPKSYTRALEASLMDRAAEVVADDKHDKHDKHEGDEPWVSLTGLPSTPDAVPLRLRSRGKRKLPPRLLEAPHPPGTKDEVVDLMRDLRSTDLDKVRRALAQPMPQLAPQVVELLGRDELAREAVAFLCQVAPRTTGVLADALLDPQRPVEVRRRLPAIVVRGEPALAAWALWRALADESFDVRYRAGAMLARLAADGKLSHVTHDDVFEVVRRELVGDKGEWRSRELAADLLDAQAAEDEVRSPSNLEHVFRMLGLVLPAEPLRIALHAVQTQDDALRGTALEYLESILPPDVRAQLWPLLEGVPVAAPEAPEDLPKPDVAAKTQAELLEELKTSYPDVLSRLKTKK